jgi:hypothetical protein
LIYIFWHIFIVNYMKNKLPKYQEFVGLLWSSKLYFSPISYMSVHIFVPVSAIFVKNLMKNEICTVKIHIIKINRILVVIFMVLEKSLCYLSLITTCKERKLTSKKFINLWKSSVFDMNPSSLCFGVSALFIAAWAHWTRSSVNLSPKFHMYTKVIYVQWMQSLTSNVIIYQKFFAVHLIICM